MESQQSSRDASIAAMGAVMRDFMARAVLFQDAVARAGGVNSTDLQIVGLLMSEGPTTPGELARRAGLTSGGAITSALDRLERESYVVRHRDATDRRKVVVTAVPETVHDRVGPMYRRVASRWEEYLQSLSDDQVEFAVELFARAAAVNREEMDKLRRD